MEIHRMLIKRICTLLCFETINKVKKKSSRNQEEDKYDFSEFLLKGKKS